MADPLSAFQKLDLVLESLTTKAPVYRDSMEICKILETNQIDIFDLELILNKLKKDSLVESSEFHEQYVVKIKYRITFEGQVFNKQGGYSQAEKISNVNLALAEARVIAGEQAQKRLNALTFWLVVGTMAVAAVEIIKLIMGK